MIKLLKRMRRQEALMALLCAVLVGVQVYFDLRLPDFMTQLTTLIKTPGSATADILDPGKTVSGAFTFGAHTYMPMIRVVVGVTWDDNMHQGKTCLYTTSELLDIGVDNKLII